MNQIKTWQQRQAETGIGSVEAKDDEIRDLRQAIEQAELMEPTEWRRKHSETGEWMHAEEVDFCDGITWEPLYTTPPDTKEATSLLSAVFDAWENGTPCYEDPENYDGFVGTAFSLDDDIFKRCCDLLNRVNPPRNAPTAPAQPATDSRSGAQGTLQRLQRIKQKHA